MTRIIPTVGRKLYFEPNGAQGPDHRMDNQPIDATVLWVAPLADGETGPYKLNLFTIDHSGFQAVKLGVPLIQAPYDQPLDKGTAYCYWMPYQVSQAKPVEGEKGATEVPEQSSVAESTQSTAPATPAPTADAPSVASANDGPATEETARFDFGGALKWLLAGRKLAREGWNGKGLFVFLVPGSTFTVNRAPLLGIYPEGTQINYNPHIDIKNVDGSISTWVPSINDCLAEDWVLVQ